MSRKAMLSIFIIATLAILPVACKKGDSGSVALGPVSDFREMVAKDAAGYVVMNFKTMSEKGLFDEVLKDAKSLEELNRFQKSTGIDPKKDLETGIIVLMSIPSGPTTGNEEMYFIASGKFDQKKITASLKEENKGTLQEEKIAGHTVYHGKITDTETQVEKDLFVSFKDNNLILFASNDASIQNAIQIVDGKKDSIAKGSKLYDMTDNVNKDHMFWGLLTIPEASKKELENGPGMMFPAFKEINCIYFGGTYDGKNLGIDANLFTEKSDSVKELATTLNSFKDMMKSFASQGEQENPETAKAMEIINKINISSEKDSVKISVSLSKEQLEKLNPKDTETK